MAIIFRSELSRLRYFLLTLLLLANQTFAATPAPTITAEQAAKTVIARHALRTGAAPDEIGTDDFRISHNAAGTGNRYDALMPAVAYSSDDREFFVVWAGNDNSSGPSPADIEIFGQRVDAQTGELVDATEILISDMGAAGNENYLAASPAVAYNSATREYLVVWSGVDQSEGEWEIYGQRISAASGTAVGSNDFRISDMGGDLDPRFGAFSPQVVVNTTDNQYLVVWYGDDNTGSLIDGEYEIFGQLLSSSGAAVGTNDFRISDMGTDGDISTIAQFPAAAYDSGNNRYAVVWQGSDGTGGMAVGEQEIYLQTLDDSGSATGTNDLRISDMGGIGDASYVAQRPSIASDWSDNTYLVVWSGSDNVGGLVAGEQEIFGQLINAFNETETGTNDFRISDMGGTGDEDYDADYPRVVFEFTNVAYLVVWTGDDSTSPLVNEEYEIFGQRILGNGAETGTNDFRISDMGTNGNTTASARLPALAYGLLDDEHLVVWSGNDMSGSQSSDEFEIYSQRIDASDGSEVGTNDKRLSTMGTDGSGSRVSWEPEVAFNPARNEYLVVWVGAYAIYGQRLDAATGDELGVDDFLIASLTQYSSDVGVTYNSEEDEYFVVFRDSLSTGTFRTGIFGQRLSSEDATALGSRVLLTDSTLNNNGAAYYSPTLAYNPHTNEYLLACRGEHAYAGSGGEESEIFVQRVDASAARLGATQRISVTGADGANYPIAALPRAVYNTTQQQYFVTWTSLSDAFFTIRIIGQRLRGDSAATVGAAITVSHEADSHPLSINGDLAYDSTNDRYFAVFTSYYTDQTFYVFGQLLNGETGAPLGSADTKISQATGTIGDTEYQDPRVTFNAADSEYLVSYIARKIQADLASNEYEVFAQRVSSTAETLGEPEQRVSHAGTDFDSRYTVQTPAVAYNTGANQYLIVWVGEDVDTDGISEIRGQLLSQPPDTDGDGVDNDTDTDDDGDGISDEDEATLGTDPLLSDSDSDGVSDGQEQTDGSNPLDQGSVIEPLRTGFCTEWNGFLDGMWNVNEYVNLTAEDRNLDATLFDINGAAQSVSAVVVKAGAQTDLLVHGMTGWTANSYGKLCSTYSGSAGDFDGRMVYYKPAPLGSTGFQFAFAMPYNNGLTGSQFVSFNTYQPSLDPVDASNLVTNWIQLTNLEDSSQSGTLYYYGQDGTILASESVVLEAGARRDFSGHQFGVSLVGMIEWRPNTSSAKFLVRNVRYYYDNAGGTNSFASAFQLDGAHGSGDPIAVPLDTRSQTAVLELLNTTNALQIVTTHFYTSAGTDVGVSTVALPAFGSVHIVADTIISNDLGMAVVDGQSTNGVVAVGMQYGRTASLGIKYVYGVLAKSALGSALRGSYNTYLGQDCTLELENPGDTARDATISLTRFDGTVVLAGQNISVPAKGTATYPVCTTDEDNNYGVVTVTPATTNTLLAQVIRLGPSDDFRFPTPVRQ